MRPGGKKRRVNGQFFGRTSRFLFFIFLDRFRHFLQSEGDDVGFVEVVCVESDASLVVFNGKEQGVLFQETAEFLQANFVLAANALHKKSPKKLN